MATAKRSAKTTKRGARRAGHPAARRHTGRALERYRQKRDFSVTPEPPPESKPPQSKPRADEGETLFVVQKHAATRLHYDFRLAHHGVLWSWAVTRGPSLSPEDRRLAVHVEDHPLDYARFEGSIPKGQYGGGTVMVWDIGTWTPLEDPDKTYKDGRLRFELHGRKLRGHWSLVRMKRREGERQDPWLLIKREDGEARPDGDSVLAEDRSVLTGRTMEEIAGDPSATWHSNRTGSETSSETRRKTLPTERATRKRSAGAALPEFVAPQLATLVDRVPKGRDWIHELKLDGYRVYCRLADGHVRFLTRRGLDWTDKFGGLGAQIDLPAARAALDGEIVVLDRKGASDFGALQLALSERRTENLVFFAFDLLHLDGDDLRRHPLRERKARLKALFERRTANTGRCVYSEHFDTNGDELYKSACRMSLEGIISKRAGAPYLSGRGTDWVKTKCRRRQEVVIGGFTERTSGPGMIGALLVGYRDGRRLVYAGKVGTGLTAANQKLVRTTLEPKKIGHAPFDTPVPRMPDVTWVKPDTICEIEFHDWTRDGRLRQPSFQGLRMDKRPTEIVREAPVPTAEVEKTMSPQPAHASRHKTAAQAPSTGKASSASKAAPPPTSANKVLDRLTHPDKVLFKTQGLTKHDLALYYADIADFVLPHLVGRPLALMRCPEGQGKACFFQKHPAAGMSPAIHRIPVRMKKSSETYLLIEDLAGLIELVQFGTLEIHPWGSRAADIERPDRIIFDLDPDPSVPWRNVVDALHEVKDLLEEIGLRCFPKTTGGKGLHAVVPIRPGPPWPEVKAFARTIAETLVARSPDRYTGNMAKRKRMGKIFVDYLRNDRGATAIAPYSTRARDGAPVAVPLAWREVTADLDPKAFDIDTVRRRLKRLKTDPWAEMLTSRQPIEKHIKALKR